MHSNSGFTRAKTAGAAPAMIDSVPSRAAWAPPVIGQSMSMQSSAASFFASESGLPAFT